MKTHLLVVPAIALIVFGASVATNPGGAARSRITRLEPDRGSPGEIITAFGQQLDQARVEELSLTDGVRTALVTIIHQTEVSIQFRIPAKLIAGRYTVVLMPVGHYGRGLEQQVILTVL